MKYLVLVLLLAGCSWLTPKIEDTYARRDAIDKMDDALDMEESALQTNLDVIEEGWSRAINGEAEQAFLDDMKDLQMKNEFTEVKIQERRAVIETNRAANLTTMKAILQKVRHMKSRKDLREIYGWLRSDWLVRLNFDESRTQIANDLRELGTKVGLEVPDGR